ncbi:MAG: GNAT family N-acetyltransferase [Nitrospirae bacterium]|nr:GNAT family N-acetyltransferase [Nitrospirota bacterium]
MENKITYGTAGENDIRGITTLFNVADPRHCRVVNYWLWSNKVAPFGGSLSLVAKIENKVIAHYSIMPLEMLMGGKTVRAGFGQQAVVHPAYRNLEIIKSLMDLAYAKAKAELSFLFAFPNDNFFLVKKQLLGWQEIDIFKAAVIDAAGLKVKRDEGTEVAELSSFPKADWLDRTEERISLNKTSEYLNWRFIGHPVNHYVNLGAFKGGEFVGYIVLKTFLRREDNKMVGHFIDFSSKGNDIDILCSLVHEAVNIFEFYKIREIVFWNRENNYKDFFQRFITGESFKTNMCCYLFDAKNEGTILDKRNWSFTMAVSDAF